MCDQYQIKYEPSFGILYRNLEAAGNVGQVRDLTPLVPFYKSQTGWKFLLLVSRTKSNVVKDTDLLQLDLQLMAAS